MITCLQHRATRIVTSIFDLINFRGANLMENMGWHLSLVPTSHIEQFRNFSNIDVRSYGTDCHVIYAELRTLMNLNTDTENII